MHRRHTFFSTTALALMLAAQGPEMSCDLGGGLDRDASPPDFGGSGQDTDDVPWPPPVTEAADSGDLGPEGGALSLLGGEVTLEIPSGSLADHTTFEVTKRLVTVRGVELVGYIWGPHGKPIEPPGRMTVSTTADDIPPWAALDQIRLMAFENGAATPLPGAEAPTLDAGRVALTGELGQLGTVVIGPLQ